MEKYNRNHILTIIDDFVSSLIKSIVPLFILFAGRLREKDGSHWSDAIAGVAFFAIVLFLAVSAFLKWYKKGYFIDQNFIVTRSGFFVVKRREIPFNKVQTINISQNILHRIFQLAELKIDTGNSTANASEISIKVGKAEAERIRETILDAKAGDGARRISNAGTPEAGNDESGEAGEAGGTGVPHHRPDGAGSFSVPGNAGKASKRYAVTTKELLVSGLTSNAVLAGFAFLASLYGLLNDYLSSLLENSLLSLGNYIGGLDFEKMTLSRIITLIAASLLVFLVFSLVLSVLGTSIKYYGFTVERAGGNITISYGLFEKKNYVIPVAKIKAVYVRQNLFRQMAGLHTIHVESIGYGNEKGEEAVLFPIAGAERKSGILAELLPEYLYEGEMNRVPKSALRRFLLSWSAFPLLLFTTLAILFSYGWLGFLLMPFFLAGGILEYRNSAVGLHEGLICLNNGAFTKGVALVAIRDIQSVADRSNFLQRRRGLFNYIISIQSNLFGKTIQVRNLSSSLKDTLMGLL